MFPKKKIISNADPPLYPIKSIQELTAQVSHINGLIKKREVLI